MNLEKSTLAHIAKIIPGATRVFREYKIDFCCSGDRLLAEALPDNVFLQSEVLRKVQVLQEHQTDFKPDDLSNQELVDRIIGRFHNRHREDLPELILLAQKVELVHSMSAHCPTGLTAHLKFIFSELSTHMEKEEKQLFPLIDEDPEKVQSVLAELDTEHDEHGQNLAKLATILNDFEVPEGACTTWRALIMGCKELVDEVMEHVHWENNILFPRLQKEEWKVY